MLTEASVRPWPHLPTFAHYRVLRTLAGTMPERTHGALTYDPDAPTYRELIDGGLVSEVVWRDAPSLVLSSLGWHCLQGDIAKRWSKVYDRVERARMRKWRSEQRPPARWEDRCANAREVLAWSNAHKWRNPLAGLELFRRQRRSITVAARHWPHLLCWDWLLTVSAPRVGYEARRIGFWKHGWLGRSGGQMGLRLYLIDIHFFWQRDHHMGALGPQYADAPKPIWDHPRFDPKADAIGLAKAEG